VPEPQWTSPGHSTAASQTARSCAPSYQVSARNHRRSKARHPLHSKFSTVPFRVAQCGKTINWSSV